MHRHDRQSSAHEPRVLRSRRQVLGAAAGGLGAALVARGLTSEGALGHRLAEPAGQTIACVPPANVLVRQEFSALTDLQLASLRRGVAEMKRRSAENPDDKTGWLFQANLHGIPGLPSVATWCQHSHWFFFPWHRMYLYWFERILRDAAGDSKLTIPYWNYLDDPAKRTLPRALGDELDADGNPNPLYEPRRAPGINDGSMALTETAVTYNLDLIDFFPPVAGAASFGGNQQIGAANAGAGAGSFEAGPHNNIHGEVGGSVGMREVSFDAPGEFNYYCSLHPAMTGAITIVDDPALPPRRFVQIADFAFFPASLTVRVGAIVRWTNVGDTDHTVTQDTLAIDSGPIPPNGYMAHPRISTRDPVFWLHHANVDRVWERWLAKKGGRRNPTDQPTWADQVFTFFDEDGIEMSGMVKDFLNIGCLGYRYDDSLTEYEPEATPTDAATPSALAPEDQAQATLLGETPPETSIVIGAEPVSTSVELPPPAAAALADIGAATPVAGARAPSLTLTLEGIENLAAPSITFAVYVNLPSGSEPDPASDAFVGTIYLFASFLHDEHEMGDAGMQQTFDITRAVQASQARADAPSDVTVTIVPVGADLALAQLATPVAEAAQPFAEAARGPWISIQRMTVTAIE